jgi:hypothetical protein
MSKFLIGKVVGLYLGLHDNTLATTPCTEATLEFTGFVGDKHAGFTRPADGRTPYYKRGTSIRNNRHASIVSREELAEIATRMGLPEVKAEWLGANLTFSGIPRLTFLPPNTRIIFPSGAVLCVSHENMPCTGPGAVIQSHYPDHPGLKSGFPKKAIHKRGVVASVEMPGLIHLGDEVQVDLATQVLYEPD